MKDKERTMDQIKQRDETASRRMGAAFAIGVVLAIISTVALVVSKLHTFAAY